MDFIEVIAEEEKDGKLLSLDDLLILNQLWRERSLAADQTARLIQKRDSDARAALQHLVERGLVEPRGVKRGKSYHLSAKVYGRLEKKTERGPRRGAGPSQQEQMVLQFLQEHKQIRRQETAALCQITSSQARALLTRLLRQGKIEAQGRTKGVFYTLPSK